MVCKMKWLWIGGEEPKDLPQWAYHHLVTALGVDPDLLTTFKCVEQVGFFEGSPVTQIRVFDSEVARGVAEIRDFASLDDHPDLIHYEGQLEKKNGKIVMWRRHGTG